MTDQATKLRPSEVWCEVCSKSYNHGTGCWDALCPYAFGKSRVLERLRGAARRIDEFADSKRAVGQHVVADELYDKAERIRVAAELHPNNPARCANQTEPSSASR